MVTPAKKLVLFLCPRKPKMVIKIKGSAINTKAESTAALGKISPNDPN